MSNLPSRPLMRRIAPLLLLAPVVGFAVHGCSTPTEQPVSSGSTAPSKAPSSMPSAMPSMTPGGGLGTVPPSTSPTPTPSAGQYTVIVQNFAFSPANLSVPVGTSVTWSFQDSTPHTSTSDPGSAVSWDSGSKGMGTSFSFTFSQAGSYPYHCTFHPGMTGTITVK